MTMDIEMRRVNKGASPRYTARLYNEDTALILLSDISSIILTYYDKISNTRINLRDEQNVLNANNVTIHATSGLLTWDIQKEDTIIVNATTGYDEDEIHIALFQWELTNGKTGNHPVRIDVTNIRNVP